jgi:type IX secretion system PorP/SprF family membrane protein
MKHFRKIYYCFLFLFVFFNSVVKAQYVYNFSSHNFLQFNPAYAGQDTSHCFFLGAELDSKLLTSDYERPWVPPYTIQLSYAGNFKKFKSGLAAIGSISHLGVENVYDVNASYNYNYVVNENSNLRIGFDFHERVVHLDPSLFIFNNIGDYDLSVIKRSSFNFDLGLWYALKKFNVGFSVHNILNKKNIQLGSSLNEKEINAIISYEFLIAGPVVTKPAIIFQNFGGNYSTYLLTNYFLFNNTFILGLEYMLRPQSDNLYGPLYIEAGGKADKQVQIMLGYSNMLKGESYYGDRISVMVKVNLY